MKENAKWMDSIEGKTTQLTNAMQTLWNGTLNSDIIKYFLDLALGITKVVDKVGLLKTVLAGITVYLAAFKKITPAGLFKDISMQVKNYNAAISQLQTLKSVTDVTSGMSMATFSAGPVQAYAAAVSSLTAKQQASALATAGLTKAQIAQVMSLNGVKDATIQQILGEQQLAASKQATVAITAEEAAVMLANNELQLSEAAAIWLVNEATGELTREKILSAVASGALQGATEADIAALLSLAGASNTAKFSLQGLKNAILGVLASNPIGWIMMLVSAIAMFAPAISKAFKSTEEKMQELEQEWDTLEDKINTASNNFKTLASSAQEVIPRFAELAEGVDKFGRNVSLTEDEYTEFLSLNNQIAEMFPEINNGMDANGNAMLSLSYTADTLTESLWNLVEAEREAANQEIADTMPEVIENIKKENDLLEDEQKNLDARMSAYQNAKDTVDRLYSDETKQAFKDMYGDEWEDFWNDEVLRQERDISQFLSAAFPSNLELLAGVVDKYTNELGQVDWSAVLNSSEIQNELSGLESQIEDIGARISKKWERLDPVVTAWVNTNDIYNNMGSDMQSAVQAMIGNIDFEKLVADGYDTDTEIQNWITNNILNPIDSMAPIARQKLSKLMSLDPSNMSYSDFSNQIKALATEIAEGSDFSYDDILKNTGYEDLLADYQKNIDGIVDALAEGEGYFDKYAEGTNALELATNELYNKIYSLSPDEVTRAFDIIKNYGINTWDELAEALENKTFDLVLDYNKESEGIEAVVAAVEESVSATGLSAESVANLQKRYQDLESYDPSRLFEMTTNGIHLNAQALNELEAEYKRTNKEALDNKLDALTEQYNDLTLEIQNCADASERATLYAQRNNVLTQINDTAELAAQYTGLTSAYNEWKQAQEGGNERDMYEGVLQGKEEIDEEISRGWLDEGTREYLELLSGQDLSTANYDKLLETYKQLGQAINSSGYSVYDFFTKDSDGNSTTDGIFNFLDAVKVAQEEIDQEWVKLNEDGGYTFDFGVNGDKAVADALGISEELVQIILRAAKNAGVEVNLDTAYSELAYLEDEAVAVNDRLKQLGATEYTFNIDSTDINDVEDQIEEAKKAVEWFENEDGTMRVGFDPADYENAKTMLATLIYQKQTLDTAAILKVDTTNAETEVETTIQKMQQFKAAYNEYEVKLAVGADVTEVTAAMEETKNSFTPEEKEIAMTLGVDLNKSNTEVNTAINNIEADAMIEVGLDPTLVEEYQAAEHTTNGEVIWNNNITKVTNWINNTELIKNAKVIWRSDTSQLTTPSVGGNSVNGTAHASGTAHANGSWGAPRTETALVGELGPELLVRGSRWTTIGDNGAEFTQIKKGDIIFNHKQTEDLLSKGYVTSRGKAYASGTAFSSGNGPGRTTIASASFSSSTSTSLNNAADNLSNAASAVSDSADEFREVFDWIEVRISEINEKLDLKAAQLENAVGRSAQNAIVNDMIDINETLYNNLAAGLNEYSNYASTLLAKIPAEYQEAAQNGTIAIEEFVGEANEETLEAIQNYRDWSDKVAELQVQMEELVSTIAELAKQRFDNISEEFENIISLFEGVEDRINAMISLVEESGYVASSLFYEEMTTSAQEQIAQLTQQLTELQNSLAQSIANGDIQIGSEEWYEMVQEIQDVGTAIIEAQTAVEEYQNAMNDIYWDNFDNLINQFGYLSEETQNMIDLLSHEDLVDEFGNWTDEGIASMGLYAQQMEIAEYQANQYAQAIADLNRDYAAGRYSESEYLEKLNELQSAQYDSIEAYHEAQEAIVDLNEARVDAIKEGIEKEIDAYQELIDKKKEELDAQKDLYDFQKNVMEQQKDIADIERKLAALSNDQSASAMAKRRQLEAELAEAKAELEETYYDRSVDQQQEAYDKEAEVFEEEKNAEIEKWEKYLENVEQVVADSLLTVQENATGVYNTLSATASEYGVTLSDAILTPWESGINAISNYQEVFDTASSETLSQLERIYSAWLDNIELANTFAEVSMYGSNASPYGTTESINNATNPQTQTTTTTTTTTNNNTDSAPAPTAIAVGGKINAGSASIYANSNGGGGSRQYFASDPIYTVLEEKNGYLKVRWHKLSSGVTGWFKKSDVKALATGTTNLKKSGIVNIDELGEELVLRAKNGRLTYMEKGSGVIPADLTSNLMSWGELNPQDMLDCNRPSIGVSPEINHTEISIDQSIGELIHIDNCSTETLPDVKKIVNEALERHTQRLNQSLRKYTR